MEPTARARAKIEVSSDLANLSPIRAFVRSFCHRRIGPAMEEDDIHQLELAVSEATANIMKHAYAGSIDERVCVEAAAYDDSVTVTLRDTGPGFIPENQPIPNLNGMKSGGMGLYIINSCVDQAIYSRSDDGHNELRLTRQIRQPVRSK